MEYRRARITQEYRRRGRRARLAASGLGATHVTHDDDNLRAASTSTSAAFASLKGRIFVLRKIVEKEIEGNNATVPGDDKIGSRVGWRFAGNARYPSNPSGIT